MNAFVKTTRGNFPNPNFYAAWKGFTELGYEVVLFEDQDLTEEGFWFSCNRSTPIFAGVQVFEEMTKKLGINYQKLDTYPDALHPFLLRDVMRTTLGDFRKKWNAFEDAPPVFVKPVEQKLFTGKVIRSLVDWIPLVGLSDDTIIYTSDPVDFVSEFRVYIRDGGIQVAKHYQGDWSKVINIQTVKDAINELGDLAPCAYALDFGVLTNGNTALVEYNDATSLGNYGMPPLKYAALLEYRWQQIAG